MENHLSKKTIAKLQFLGIYQMAGGIAGLALTGWLIFTIRIFSPVLLLVILLAVGLYAFSIYCGSLSLKKKISKLNFSLVNQILQLVNFKILGLTFLYISGFYFSAGLDLTDSFLFLFNLGISSWQITINGDAAPIIISFNFVALFLVVFIERLKTEIRKDQADREIELIGQSQA